MKKQGDSILVIGGGSHVFRNSRLNTATVAFLFGSEGSGGVLSQLLLSHGLAWPSLLPASHVPEQTFFNGLPGYYGLVF